MRSFTEIFNQFSQAAIAKLPFGEDYRHVNALKSLIQQRTTLSKQLEKYSSSETTKHVAEVYKHFCEAQQEWNESIDGTDEELAAVATAEDALFLVCNNLNINTEAAEKVAKLEYELACVKKKLDIDIIPFFNALLSSSINAMTSWQKTILADYSNQENEPAQDSFIRYISACSDHYLPKEYLEEPGQRFPSAVDNNYYFGFAHFQACKNKSASTNTKAGLLASRAPKKMARKPGELVGETQDDKSLQSFLEMLFNANVTAILSLCPTGDRLNYKLVSSGRFQTKFDEENKAILITDTLDPKNPPSRKIHFSHFDVPDQKQLDLPTAELTELLHVYKHYQAGMVLVHCDSGVGRTGQIRLLFGLLDLLSDRSQMQIDIALLIDALVNDRETDCSILVEALFKAMIKTLNELRQTRYCVETEPQFLGSLPLMVLLVATQKNCYSAGELNKLRKSLGIKEMPENNALVSKQKFFSVPARSSDKDPLPTPQDDIQRKATPVKQPARLFSRDINRSNHADRLRGAVVTIRQSDQLVRARSSLLPSSLPLIPTRPRVAPPSTIQDVGGLFPQIRRRISDLPRPPSGNNQTSFSK